MSATVGGVFMRAMKSVVGLAVIILSLIVSAGDTPHAGKGANMNQEVAEVPITMNQLAPENGVIPVELKGGTARLSAPNELQSYSCVIKNNTDQRIRSFSIVFTIVNERDGEELRVSWFTAYDMLIHPDFNDLTTDKFIPPKGEYTLRSAGSNTIENVVIKGVEIKLDHVEFSGGMILGANEGGLNVVARRREGAAKFKQWLKQKYLAKGKSVNAITAMIEKRLDSPAELGFGDDALVQGAEMYRMLLLKRYNARGATELERVLSN